MVVKLYRPKDCLEDFDKVAIAIRTLCTEHEAYKKMRHVAYVPKCYGLFWTVELSLYASCLEHILGKSFSEIHPPPDKNPELLVSLAKCELDIYLSSGVFKQPLLPKDTILQVDNRIRLLDWSRATVFTGKTRLGMDQLRKKRMLDGFGAEFSNPRWKHFREAGWITDEELSQEELYRLIVEGIAARGKTESLEDEEECQDDSVDGYRTPYNSS